MHVELEIIVAVGDTTTTRRLSIEDPSDLVIESMLRRLLDAVQEV